MAEQGTGESSPDTDRDFDPTAEMLIHDYDDEQTLDEEEAMSNGESVVNELAQLQEESEMPMEELLAMYGYAREAEESQEAGTSANAVVVGDANSEEEPAAVRTSSQPMEVEGGQTESLDNSDQDKSNSELESVPSQMARLLSADLMEVSTDEDEEEDEDYDPDNDEEWKKIVQVGSDYQAIVPDGLEPYGDVPVYEGEDRLLWDPKALCDPEIEKYLGEVQLHNMSNAQGVNAIPTGAHVRDDEQALYLLLNCEHNLDEALRRHKMQSVPTSDPMSLWSEEECRNFELGLRAYGKDFFLNRQHKVRTRSVKELVQFYYLWKKTERHDAFAARTRLEKKKYSLHPGITDYMDRFLDEHENLPESQDQLTGPNIRTLLYGDSRRQDGRSSEELTAALEIVQNVANSSTVDFLLPEKFREDVQAMVLGSLVTDQGASAPKDLHVDGSGANTGPETSQEIDKQCTVPLGNGNDQAKRDVTVEESRNEVLPGSALVLSSSQNTEVVPEADPCATSDSETLPPPLKKPRLALQHDVEVEDASVCPERVSGQSETDDTNDVNKAESICLSQPLNDSGSGPLPLTASTSSVEKVESVPVGGEPGTDVFITSYAVGATGSTSGVNTDSISGGLSTASNNSDPASFGPFPSTAESVCIALESNLDGIDSISPLDDSIMIEGANPGLQRLTSLDSIEPSIPALDTFSPSIESYASVLGCQGNPLESMNVESLTSVLEGFAPETAPCAAVSVASDAALPPVEAPDGLAVCSADQSSIAVGDGSSVEVNHAESKPSGEDQPSVEGIPSDSPVRSPDTVHAKIVHSMASEDFQAAGNKISEANLGIPDVGGNPDASDSAVSGVSNASGVDRVCPNETVSTLESSSTIISVSEQSISSTPLPELAPKDSGFAEGDASQERGKEDSETSSETTRIIDRDAAASCPDTDISNTESDYLSGNQHHGVVTTMTTTEPGTSAVTT